VLGYLRTARRSAPAFAGLKAWPQLSPGYISGSINALSLLLFSSISSVWAARRFFACCERILHSAEQKLYNTPLVIIP
jgi:hypothetical protein